MKCANCRRVIVKGSLGWYDPSPTDSSEGYEVCDPDKRVKHAPREGASDE